MIKVRADSIYSKTGLTKFENLAGYDQNRPLDSVGPNDFVTKTHLFGAISGVEVSIPAGSPRPFIIDMTLPQFANVPVNVKPQVSLLTDGDYETATKRRPVNDVPVDIEYVDASRSALKEIQVTGYEDFADITGETTQFDLVLIL